MKCLNPACNALTADEINVSVNVSLTNPVDQTILKYESDVYAGETEMGDCSDLIATTCYRDGGCGKETYVHNWKEIVSKATQPPDNGRTIILPKPRPCYECGTHADYTDSRNDDDTSGWRCKDHALETALMGYQVYRLPDPQGPSVNETPNA
jgi:hypothetical protein